ncbi:MAG: D-alanyl-D-alanine carboxypeptidase family protein [Hyphomicrobiales bacterium]
MKRPAPSRRSALVLGTLLLFAAALAPSGARAASSASASSKRVSATAATKSRSKKAVRSRPRRRSRTLRLPAVTPHGIPRLHVKAAYVEDAASGQVLFQKNPERVYPIASLTKLVSALVLLDTNPDWDRVVEVIPEDVHNSSRSRIRAREEISVRDLFHASLMSSDNVATKALARTSGLTASEFVRRMNAKADSLGLTGAHFVEPTGLSEENVATAQAVAKLLRTAADNDIVSAIMQKQTYEFTSNRRLHRLVNTNRLLRSKWHVTAGKTGFIHEAGYCLATNIEGPTGAEITAVVLGAPSNALRFAEARRILDWTFRFGLNAAGAADGGNE